MLKPLAAVRIAPADNNDVNSQERPASVVDLPTAIFPAPSAYAGFAIALVLAAAFALFWGAHRRQVRRLEHEAHKGQLTQAKLLTARQEFEECTQQRIEALEQRNRELMQQRKALLMANQRLRRLAALDSLTGIANRRHFDRSLDREVRRARREGRPLSLIFLDLDEFKHFNDSYGHPRGDEVLRHVAQTLNETFRRGGDFVARYGGEEFAVVLPDVDARRAALYAERLRRRIWRLNIPYGNSSSGGRVTMSGGVATLTPRMQASAEQLLHAADQALYRAKCAGRNQIASAAVDMEERVEAALAS